MEKIAVIGLSCLFPEAQDPEQFWRNLLAERDSTSEATAEDIGADPAIYYDARPGLADKTYYLRGGYIRDFSFDPDGYQVPASFLDGLDDLFKWSLYVAKEALRDAGYLGNQAALSRCGVILGKLSFPNRTSHRLFSPLYLGSAEAAIRELLQRDDFALDSEGLRDEPNLYNAALSGYPATVIAHALSLSEVNFALDAACASSLYAVELAAQYLRTHKADLMLAGGVGRADMLGLLTGFSSLRAFPENGISQPLSKTSGGLTVSEGAGMVALKRLSDAIRDGDRIYATICGVGLSNDGEGKHPLTPNPKGQALAYERAYAAAGLDPASIDYVECHATGTQVGDIVELNSMETYFGPHRAAPLIGAVKSNVGHLLTAAGMVGLLKVILSMQQDLIPATIQVTEPLSSQNSVIGADQIVRSARPWPQRGAAKRAAVSAFGFGGTNAHLILEREQEVHQGRVFESVTVEAASQPKMAIVGMDAHFGSSNGLDQFERTIYAGIQHFGAVPHERWKGLESQPDLLAQHGLDGGAVPQGAYIRDFNIDALRLKIPPNEVDQLNPQQLLILKVADNAVRDAGLEPGANVAVIIGMGTELALHRHLARQQMARLLKPALEAADIRLPTDGVVELETIAKDSFQEATQVGDAVSKIGNIMANRISALWNFTGPSLTLSAEESSVPKALEIAQMLLAEGTVEGVVLGAVDLSGGVENVLVRNRLASLNSGEPTLSYGETANGWLVGEGAGAVVLQRAEQAMQEQRRTYAVIEGLSIVHAYGTASDSPQPAPAAEAVRRSCQLALDRAGRQVGDIGYLELNASGVEWEDQAEIQGLLQTYRTSQAALGCAVGSVKANLGHTYAAAGIAGLIKTALCLYHRYVPGTPGWSAPRSPELWDGAPFFVAARSVPWLLEKRKRRRVAALSNLGLDGAAAHVILAEVPYQKSPRGTDLQQTPIFLFPLAADSQQGLLDQLDELDRTVQGAETLFRAAHDSLVAYQGRPEAAYAVAIVGRDQPELRREIEMARQGLPLASSNGSEWKTPLGSYFAANPLGKHGTVSLVYPGAFNSYVGMGQDLFRHFPKIHDRLADLSAGVEQDLAQLLYPRSLRRLTPRELEELDAQLLGDAIAMLRAGTVAALGLTSILRDIFQLRPQAAFGYSLGELSMLVALDAWTDVDQLHDRLASSPLFRTRLSGPKNAVREHWRLPPAPDPSVDEIWHTYVLLASPEAVAEVLRDEDHVYLTHINSPTEVAIAGDLQGCLRAIQALKCDSFRAPFNDVLHCEVMRSEYDGFVDLFDVPAHPVPEVAFYSAAKYAPVRFDGQSVAQSIASALCKPLDFPRLIDRAYADGARIFIEIGPGGTCSRWIDETLRDKAHVAMSMNRRGMDELASVFKVLAMLVSHRVSVDLSPLYDMERPNGASGSSIVKTVTLGGRRIRSTILSAENKRRFEAVVSGTQEPEGSPAVQTPQLSVAELAATAAEPSPQSRSEVSRPTARLLGYEELAEASGRLADAHAAFLELRQNAVREMDQLMRRQLAAYRVFTARSAPNQRPALDALGPRSPTGADPGPGTEKALPQQPPSTVVFDEADIQEFAAGSIAHVFGKDYEMIDSYPRRVRLPLPPYLFVSRVTGMEATRGKYEPCWIQTEYDIPRNAWYSVDGQVPGIVPIEASHANTLLVSYLGVDTETRGQRLFRALDGQVTFLSELPQEGDTLRCELQINRFARTGGTLLFFYSYQCSVGDRPLLEMKSGAGFFLEEELEAAKGIPISDRAPEALNPPKERFEPLLRSPKSVFDQDDLARLSEGDLAGCFGEHYWSNGRNRSLRLPPAQLRMLDRVTSVDPAGGSWGLGSVVAEKALDPADWYFNCHFKDDWCMPGTLLGEGCSQLLQFYLLYAGLQSQTSDARFQPLTGQPITGYSRGQITPVSDTVTYRLDVRRIGLAPRPFAVADIDIVFRGRLIARCRDLGVQLSEEGPVR